MNAKPHFVVINGTPVPSQKRETPIDAARRRFGQRFAHEHGSKWRPRDTPFLAEWLASRIKERR